MASGHSSSWSHSRPSFYMLRASHQTKPTDNIECEFTWPPFAIHFSRHNHGIHKYLILCGDFHFLVQIKSFLPHAVPQTNKITFLVDPDNVFVSFRTQNFQPKKKTVCSRILLFPHEKKKNRRHEMKQVWANCLKSSMRRHSVLNKHRSSSRNNTIQKNLRLKKK